MPRSLIELAPGRLVAGRYRLLRPLGSGGSAYVWAACDEALGREVAVKALSGSASQGGHERERLRREAQLLAALDDPHITTVFDYIETPEEDGTTQPVLVTELVEGENLSVRLKAGPLPPQEALAVCAQVAQALAAAHRAGVVHRDVKPANVMLTGTGAKLLDFGISRRATDTDLTGNVLIGTPACMAPEQWLGRPALPASDVYALGCLLYWCLAGRAPYADRELPALGLAHLQDAPPPLPLPRPHSAVEALYDSCLHKDPASRPNAGSVADVLGAADVRPLAAAVAPMIDADATVAMRPPRRRAGLATAVGSGVAVLTAAIVLPLTLMDADTGGGSSPARAATTTHTATTAAAAAKTSASSSAADSVSMANVSDVRPAASPPAGAGTGGGHGRHHGKDAAGGGHGGG